MVWLALSVIPDDRWRAATLPLFEEGLVDALEWSPDQAWTGAPAWTDALLDHYAAAGRVDLHGVTLSPFSATWTARQRTWLEAFAGACRRWTPRLVSEHVGFMAGGPFTQGAPLPPAPLEAAIAIGRDRLARLAAAAQAANPAAQAGLEPLALALSPGDVDDQAALLRAVLAPGPDLPGGGFLVLDLHNAWCQALNAGRDVRAVIEAWPLERARVVHLSGGSWSTPRGDPRPFRRDTHDAEIPDEVLALLPHALARAPRVEVVVVERLAHSLADPALAAAFAAQVRALRDLLPPGDPPDPLASDPAGPTAASARASSTIAGSSAAGSARSIDEPALAAAQAALLLALEQAREVPDFEALRALGPDALAPLRAQLARAEPRALEVAADLVRRWGRRDG